MSAWPEKMIVWVLRAGVILSICVVITGMVLMSSHPAAARPAPKTIGEVVAGVRSGSGEAIVMAGLLILIATPVARVALSIVLFIVERDRLYVMITTAVLLILLVGFVTGAPG
jgi:uncharacterized membrane protein